MFHSHYFNLNKADLPTSTTSSVGSSITQSSPTSSVVSITSSTSMSTSSFTSVTTSSSLTSASQTIPTGPSESSNNNENNNSENNGKGSVNPGVIGGGVVGGIGGAILIVGMAFEIHLRHRKRGETSGPEEDGKATRSQLFTTWPKNSTSLYRHYLTNTHFSGHMLTEILAEIDGTPVSELVAERPVAELPDPTSMVELPAASVIRVGR